MNPWKPIAAASVAAFALSLVVACGSSPPPPPAPPPPPGPAAPAGPGACANQPNMMAAVSSLEKARAWLERAEHNKGGWREAAVVATNNALNETVRGCQVADVH